MQALIVIFCCVVACPLAMLGFMWWLDRNPAEVEMRKEVRRLEKVQAKRKAEALTDHVGRAETPLSLTVAPTGAELAAHSTIWAS